MNLRSPESEICDSLAVEELRQKFESTYQDELRSGAYDLRDIERVCNDSKFLSCFVRHQHGNVNKAVTMMDTSLRWRKELALSELTSDSFPKDLRESGCVFYHNTDKQGQLILHIRVSKHKKTSPETNLIVRKYFAWMIDKVFTQRPGHRIVVLYDMTDAGLSNVELDLIKFQIACFTTYYPAVLAYMLIFEMPWILNAIWKLIKQILTPEQQKFVLLVKKPEITNYIEVDQLFVHMGGTDTYTYQSSVSSDDDNIADQHVLCNGGRGVGVGEGVGGGGDSDGERSLMSSGEYTPPGGTPLDNSTAGFLRKRVTFVDIPRSKSCASVFVDTTDSAFSSHTPTPPSFSTSTKSTLPALDSSVHQGALASIKPGVKLSFLVSDQSQDSAAHIVVSNTANQRTSFKVKTTSPDIYRVRPHTGLIDRNDSADITVTLLAGHQCSARDKFLVMLLTVDDAYSGGTNMAALNAIWKNVSKDSHNYTEHRLSCDMISTLNDLSLKTNARTGHNSTHPTTIKHANNIPSSDTSLSDKVDWLIDRQKKAEDQLKLITRLLLAFCAFFIIITIFIFFTR